MLKNALRIASTSLLLALAGPTFAADAPQENLFENGLKGWTSTFREPGVKMEDVFTIDADGVLHDKGQPIGYIRTEKDYTSFKLDLDWRFTGKPGNGGVLLRMTGEDKVWPKSIVCQLQSENAGDIWNIDKFPMKVAEDRTEDRRTVKEHPTNEKPLGEWNHYEITLDGGYLELKVNGLVQNVATDCEIVPGKIVLQSEGAAIEIRNLVLTPLPDKGTGKHAATASTTSTNNPYGLDESVKISKLDGLEGWSVWGNGHWTLEDGVIDGQQTAAEKTYTHIVSDKSYKDFKASLQFKCLAGNSGFYFRVKPDKDGKMHGIQAEIDAAQNVGGLYESYGRNWLDLPKPEVVADYFKPQEWNLMEVEGHGPHVVVHINGKKAGEINDPTINMEGPFALQIHGGQDVHVQFKDIKVEELPAEKQ